MQRALSEAEAARLVQAARASRDFAFFALALDIGARPSVERVAARLGHKSTQVLLDTYAHVIPECEEVVTHALSEALFGDGAS